jgi:hypothetical protein
MVFKVCFLLMGTRAFLKSPRIPAECSFLNLAHAVQRMLPSGVHVVLGRVMATRLT